eukprot:UN23767
MSLSFTIYVPKDGETKISAEIERYIIRTNTVSLNVIRGQAQIIEKPEGEVGIPEHGGNERRNLGGHMSTHEGVPYWDYACQDEPKNTGWIYNDGTYPSCSYLSRAGKCRYDPGTRAFCPVTCHSCGGMDDKWKYPQEDRTYTFNSNCDTTEHRNIIDQAESMKSEMCATVLWYMMNDMSPVESTFDTWFGMTENEHTDDQNFQTVYEHYVRICSADKYTYNCDPTTDCDSDYIELANGKRWSNRDQHDLIHDDDFNLAQFVSDCKRNRCGYSGTIAYVEAGSTNPRTINLCPILFWVQSDLIMTGDYDSKASVFVHELSHFIDIANSDDLTYNIATQKV